MDLQQSNIEAVIGDSFIQDESNVLLAMSLELWFQIYIHLYCFDSMDGWSMLSQIERTVLNKAKAKFKLKKIACS